MYQSNVSGPDTFDHQATHKYTQVWQLFIESQQTILSATQFVIEMNRHTNDFQEHMLPLKDMHDLHHRIDGLLVIAKQHTRIRTNNPDDPEAIAAQALRSMSIVKLNR